MTNIIIFNESTAPNDYITDRIASIMPIDYPHSFTCESSGHPTISIARTILEDGTERYHVEDYRGE